MLNLGLNFTPTPNIYMECGVREGLDRFCRNVRIVYQFRKYNECTLNKVDIGNHWQHVLDWKFKLPNPRFVPKMASPHIEKFLEELSVDILNRVKKVDHLVARKCYTTNPSNFPPYFKEVIKELKEDSNIVIQPADKNLGPTIVDKTWYHSEMMRHLLDSEVYLPCTEDISTIVNRVERKMEGVMRSWKFIATIPDSLHEFIMNYPLPTCPCEAYLLPKIHKEKVEGRLICPNSKWVTLPLSKWLAAELNELAFKCPYILKDSRQVVKELKDLKIPKSSILLTFDVVSLYPSINHEIAKTNIMHFFDNKAKGQCVLDLLDIVMLNNFISYDDKLWHQIRGTAMGTLVAPPYANLFLGKFEVDVLRKVKTHPLYYRRFIDDGFLIWNGPHEELSLFLHLWNSTYPSIKITHSHLGSKSVAFMDLTISIDEDNEDENGLCPIIFNSYEKPLNKYLYIPYSSYCPKYIFKGFIKGRVISLAINNSKKEDFVTSLGVLKERLMRRGYPSKFINNIFDLVSHEDRDLYLTNNHMRQREKRRSCGLFVKFSPKSNELLQLRSIIHKVYDKHKEGIKDIIPSSPFVGYYKGSTLKHLLTKK